MRQFALALLALCGAFSPAAADGMPEEVAAKLRAIGPRIDPPSVYKIYADALAQQPRDGVEVVRDVAYGPDERQRFDLYRPAGPVGADAKPAFAFFHGGGFVRGDRSDRANVGYYFARRGVVTALPSYRLAPKDPWPAGAQDVANVAAFLREHAKEYGVDPARITIGGESAGAAHVAAAAMLPGQQTAAGLGAARLVLLSGVYDADLETRARSQFGIPTPDPRNDAYFGTDRSTFAAKSTALAIGGAPVPVLLTFSELDPPQMLMQAGEFFANLCRSPWGCPRLREFLGHDHISTASSIGTQDETVSAELLAFITQR